MRQYRNLLAKTFPMASSFRRSAADQNRFFFSLSAYGGRCGGATTKPLLLRDPQLTRYPDRSQSPHNRFRDRLEHYPVILCEERRFVRINVDLSETTVTVHERHHNFRACAQGTGQKSRV
jgi:hypothetical protein